MNSYVSIDLETTGLNPGRDKIIEIGAVKVLDGERAGTFSSLVNPGRKLEPGITELTGIREEDLRDAPYIEDVLEGVLDFLGDLPLLGHSILFDYSFLKKAAVNAKKTFEKQAVDTLKIARKYLPELESRSLEYLCRYYHITHQAHRALTDAEATLVLYDRLKEQFYTREDSLFCPSALVFKVKRDQPATKQQKEKLYFLTARHKIVLDVEIARLTRSEASRLTDLSLSRSAKIHRGIFPEDSEE